MNSEELELSLRTEFEHYLKGVVAGMRQDVEDFKKNFEAEFEKHKAQMDGAFRDFSERFDSDVTFDKAFTESVVEHLRLARDDGAQLSALAFSEAQKLEQVSSTPSRYDQLRDSINDISNQPTQAAILKSLVDHVARFTPRGAFFVVKQDKFVCWRRFDADGSFDDESLREINFPVSADTVLAEAVDSLVAIEAPARDQDDVYLNALGFGRPNKVTAVPLTARGRGVAVLYADNGGDYDAVVNLEAIESLVRVAALTVELRAASSTVTQPVVSEPAPAHVPTPVEEPAQEAAPAAESYEETAYAEPAAVESEPEVEAQPAWEAPAEVETQPQYSGDVEEYTGGVMVEEPAQEPAFESHQAEYVETVEAQPEADVVEEVQAAEPEPVSDFAFSSSNAYDASSTEPEPEPAAEPAEEYAYAGEQTSGANGHAYEAAPEPVVEVATAQPIKRSFSDRHVDLPIEVSDDERKLHNDARRFARLLVSEIKLYNEQKVNEGRDASDLYDRLREAIDRSREMYDKRVQPAVAAKFDYFHYELVNNLAEGSDTKLGASYPGANV